MVKYGKTRCYITVRGMSAGGFWMVKMYLSGGWSSSPLIAASPRFSYISSNSLVYVSAFAAWRIPAGSFSAVNYQKRQSLPLCCSLPHPDSCPLPRLPLQTCSLSVMLVSYGKLVNLAIFLFLCSHNRIYVFFCNNSLFCRYTTHSNGFGWPWNTPDMNPSLSLWSCRQVRICKNKMCICNIFFFWCHNNDLFITNHPSLCFCSQHLSSHKTL